MKAIIRIVLIKTLNMVVDTIIGVFLSLVFTIVVSLAVTAFGASTEPAAAFSSFAMTWRRTSLSWIWATAIYHGGTGIALAFICGDIAWSYRESLWDITKHIPLALDQRIGGYYGGGPGVLVHKRAKPLAMPLIQRLYLLYQWFRRREG